MTINHPSFGKLDDNRVIMFDTTLRDGEQSPGFSMTLEEKLRGMMPWIKQNAVVDKAKN